MRGRRTVPTLLGMVAIAIANRLYVWVPGYQVLSPNEAALLTSALTGAVIVTGLIVMDLIAATGEWAERKLDLETSDPAWRELCLIWLKTIRGTADDWR